MTVICTQSSEVELTFSKALTVLLIGLAPACSAPSDACTLSGNFDFFATEGVATEGYDAGVAVDGSCPEELSGELTFIDPLTASLQLDGGPFWDCAVTNTDDLDNPIAACQLTIDCRSASAFSLFHPKDGFIQGSSFELQNSGASTCGDGGCVVPGGSCSYSWAASPEQGASL
jgi:hypothetical protein